MERRQHAPVRRTTAWSVALLALCLPVLAACGGGPKTDTPDKPDFRRYVALGDSYTSGPGIEPMTPGPCLRSTVNYPALVASALHIKKVTDVSCGGAASTNLVTTQALHPAPAPQLDAVTSDTDLVTMGFGFNDLSLSYGLLFACLMPKGVPSEGCKQLLATPASRDTLLIEAVARRVATAIEDVQKKAPHATVVLVGYPRIVPDSGSCPSRLPLPDAMLERLRQALALMNDEWQKVAKATGADYVDMYAVSKGHDICSADPWIDGGRNAPGQASALHPFRAYHRAVARAVVKVLGK
jgi:lysophospholipase L1-like esterase